MNFDFIEKISRELSIKSNHVHQVLKLLEEGSTIPFIARYRKESTGSMDEVSIAKIQSLFAKLTEFEKRREAIIKSITDQEKMTPEIMNSILKAETLNELEDIYLPFKPKKKTRASVARENGLEPLALRIFKLENADFEMVAKNFINQKVTTVETALQGAKDIIAEWINENSIVRGRIRRLFEYDAVISSHLVRGKEEQAQKYKDYFRYSEKLKYCKSNRLLAVLRGENEGLLKVKIEVPEEKAIGIIENQFLRIKNKSFRLMMEAITDGYDRLIQPSMETEFRNEAKEKADKEAVDIFASNLKQLLLESPLGSTKLLAIDPGYRTGCKVVCLDLSGNPGEFFTIYPFGDNKNPQEAVGKLKLFVNKYKINTVAIGNGTAGRETEIFVKNIDFGEKITVFMVSEDGASIYSASETARDEFPDLDITVRGAISIGRRLIDPLAELVKIDAKNLGIGQYQHDVDQKLLRESLDRVVESCVNYVGVELNTASKELLSYVSGLGPQLARNIVEYRNMIGSFTSRSQLNEVPRLGPKAFEQSAGFLRIKNAENPLDASAVHPERYPLVVKIAKDVGVKVESLMQNNDLQKQIDINKYVTESVGIPTLTDILNELAKPGRDPREQKKHFEFEKGIFRMEDIEKGMELPGIVTNITEFGAFIDVGVKEQGLVHKSQISNTFVKNPMEVLTLHQEVRVKVIDLDFARRRISLTMKNISQ